MTPLLIRPVVRGVRYVLAHTPGLVRYGSKPTRELAKEHKLEAPITEEVYQVLYEDREPKVGVRNLMTRQPKSET